MLEFVCTMVRISEVLEFCRPYSKEEACLIASLNTQDMALWDFFQGKEQPATEEKVYTALAAVIVFFNSFISLWNAMNYLYHILIFVMLRLLLCDCRELMELMWCSME